MLAAARIRVIFVVGAEMTRRRLAERAVETVMSTRPKQLGVVLNKVDFARNKYNYSRYYGHQYKKLLRRSFDLAPRRACRQRAWRRS